MVKISAIIISIFIISMDVFALINDSIFIAAVALFLSILFILFGMLYQSLDIPENKKYNGT